MAEIKAIETFYNGYRFRSRLEARWAVFFDSAGIKYEYESEGYEVDDIKYLPDFYLPELDVHIEVKPDRNGIEKDIIKCSKMLHWGGAIKVIIFLGNIPSLDIKNGGHWHFPALYYQTGRYCNVEVGWWYFEDICDDNGNPIGVSGEITNARYPIPFSIDDNEQVHGRCIGYRKVPPYGCEYAPISLRPITDFELRNEKEKDKDHLELCIDFLKSRNEIFYSSLEKAKQARFEHGESGIVG